MLSPTQGQDGLAAAIAAAMRSAFREWHREHGARVEPDVAYAQWVKRVEANVQVSPGRHTFVVVEIIDRRPGRAHLSSYAVEQLSGRTQLKLKHA